jgi:hypothetical protein
MEGRAAAIRISGLRALEVCSIAFFVLDQWMAASPSDPGGKAGPHVAVAPANVVLASRLLEELLRA